MPKKKLIIYGTGSFAEYVSYVFENDSPYEVCGFCMESSVKNPNQHHLFGKPFAEFEKITDIYPPSDYFLFVAVGNNIIRKRIYTTAKAKGYSLPNYISSKTTYWENLKIGDNCFIDEGTVLQPFTSIGSNSIIFVSAIGHHTKIGNHNLISVCTTGGNVNIADNCFIGMNSVIKPNVKIAENTIIGMGCVVVDNTENDGVYMGNPTKKRDATYEQMSKKFL